MSRPGLRKNIVLLSTLLAGLTLLLATGSASAQPVLSASLTGPNGCIYDGSCLFSMNVTAGDSPPFTFSWSTPVAVLAPVGMGQRDGFCVVVGRLSCFNEKSTSTLLRCLSSRRVLE